MNCPSPSKWRAWSGRFSSSASEYGFTSSSPPPKRKGYTGQVFKMCCAGARSRNETVGRGQQRNLATIARTEEVARIVQDGRAVGETVEHVLAAARIDEMEIHLARLPAGVGLADRVGGATRNAGCRKRAKRGGVLEKVASIQYQHDLFLITIIRQRTSCASRHNAYRWSLKPVPTNWATSRPASSVTSTFTTHELRPFLR